MINFITAKNDRIFKTIFVQKEDHHLMENLLHDCLGKEVKIKEYLKVELGVSNVSEKAKRLDLLVESEKETMLIELNTEGISINKRNLMYFSKFYGTRVKVGESYNKDKNNYILINLSYNKKDNKKKREYYIQDEELKKYVNNFIVIEFNMDEITKECYDRMMKGKEIEYKYLAMLNLGKEELEKLSRSDSIVEEYMKKLEELNNDEVFIGPVRIEEDEKMIQKTLLEDVKNEGKNEGLEIGTKQGLEKGMYESKIKIAKAMIKEQESIEKIIKYTSLTEDEIENLK